MLSCVKLRSSMVKHKISWLWAHVWPMFGPSWALVGVLGPSWQVLMRFCLCVQYGKASSRYIEVLYIPRARFSCLYAKSKSALKPAKKALRPPQLRNLARTWAPNKLKWCFKPSKIEAWSRKGDVLQSIANPSENACFLLYRVACSSIWAS